MTAQDELMHYGVLGMKWGQRRAAQRGETYSYKSHTTKKYEAKAERAEAHGKTDKAKTFANRAKNSAKLDRDEQRIADKMNVGVAVVANLLTGGMASRSIKSYSRYRGMGESATKAALKSYFLMGLPVDRIQKAEYIRKDDFE